MKKRLIAALLIAVSVVVQSSTTSAFCMESVIVPHSISIVDGILDSECPEDLSFSFGKSEVVVPITVCERGSLLIGVRKRCNNPYRGLTLQLYRDSSCTELVSSIMEFEDSPFTSSNVECTETGTYYLRAELLRTDEVDQEMLFSLSVNFVSNVNRSLKEEETVCGFGDTDYSFSLIQDGCAVFSFSGIDSFLNPNSISLDLLNSDGSLVRQGIRIIASGMEGEYSAVFARKAGTYHLRVYSLVPYALNYSCKQVFFSSKETAKRISFNREYFGVVENSSCNWFCLDLNKRQRVHLVYNTSSGSSLNFELLDSNGCSVQTNVISNGVLKTAKKCKKGTYYLRVSTKGYSAEDDYSFVLKE